jgi:hypothetical protein
VDRSLTAHGQTPNGAVYQTDSEPESVDGEALVVIVHPRFIVVWNPSGQTRTRVIIRELTGYRGV